MIATRASDNRTIKGIARFLAAPSANNISLRGLLALCAAFAIWLAVVLAALTRHEFARDEVRAFSIATASHSLADIPSLLINEGHPIVWYGLLHAANEVLRDPI